MKTALSSIVLAGLVGVLGTVSACSSSESSSSGGTQDPGATGGGDTSAASAPDTSPDGTPYPTTNLGQAARVGQVPGSTIRNYKFLGYPDGDISKGLQPMSLASFYDPTGTKYKLIHLQASGSWCVFCKEETKIVSTLAKELAERKVAWIITLAEGPVTGTPSTKADLDRWIADFQAPFTHFLDPGNRNLGVFYNAAALPWNASIDAKTMEILSADVGAITNKAALLAEVDDQLAKTK